MDNHNHKNCSVNTTGFTTSCCNHEHSHENNESNNKHLKIILLSISTILLIFSFFINQNITNLIICTLATILSGYSIFFKGLKSISKLKFEENTLLLISVVSAFIIGEYLEASLVTILFSFGTLMESFAVSKSINMIEKLIEIRPEKANIINETGNIKLIDAKDVKIGDTILIKTGDKIPLDCIIIEGSSSVDNSTLTGESIPLFASINDNLMSGGVNISGNIKCKVTKTFENSTASQIIDLVYNSTKQKGETEKFISKFARLYTPIVIVLAIVIAIILPLLGLTDVKESINRALIFLVASCPCALVISIPITFFSSIAACSKIGVLVKGSKFIEKIAKVTCVAFDKTGTITSGNLKIDSINYLNQGTSYKDKQLLNMIGSIESFSNHPIATTILKNIGDFEIIKFDKVQETPGLGLTANINNDSIICGSKRLMNINNISTDSLPNANIYFSINDNILAYITLKEEISDNNIDTIKYLKTKYNKKVVMITGDNQNNAKSIADKCSIEDYYYELLPNDKVKKIEELKKSNTCMFVGDGINDAPVIAISDIGASMGLGSEIANMSSDLIIMNNDLSKLTKLFSITKQTIGIAKFNIYISIISKLVVFTLGIIGLANLWVAVFADVGISMIAILNALRIIKSRKNF